MTPEEIKKQIVAIENHPVFPTIEPTIFRTEWTKHENGAKTCVLYTVLNGQPAATPAIVLPNHDEQKAIQEAIERFGTV